MAFSKVTMPPVAVGCIATPQPTKEPGGRVARDASQAPYTVVYRVGSLHASHYIHKKTT